MKKLKSLEITPEKIYLSRRKFLAGVGAVAAGLIISSGCESVNKVLEEDTAPPKSPLTGASKDELGNRLTSFKNITTYNNFYEFTTDKEVAGVARNFKTRPWTIRVSGQVSGAPRAYARGTSLFRVSAGAEPRTERLRRSAIHPRTYVRGVLVRG